MTRIATLALVGAVVTLAPMVGACQTQRYPLTSVDGLRPHNVVVDAVPFQGRRSVRVTIAPEVARRAAYLAGQVEPEAFALIEGSAFAEGVLEAELAGAPSGDGYPGARGFVGLAFRVQPPTAGDGPQTYDAVYLRPTNGRAEDQERRNHAVQYISHPAWTWSRLRRETPSRYEAYVDLVPDAWIKIRLEVRGAVARLYVHDGPHPILIIRDLKSGATARGALGLWIGPGTVAHFRNLVVRP